MCEEYACAKQRTGGDGGEPGQIPAHRQGNDHITVHLPGEQIYLATNFQNTAGTVYFDGFDHFDHAIFQESLTFYLVKLKTTVDDV